jgi:hypothetical protein
VRALRCFPTQQSFAPPGEIPGIGPITGTAFIAATGNGAAFRKGRDGVVAREYSAGGKQKLLGIGKRGNAFYGDYSCSVRVP